MIMIVRNFPRTAGEILNNSQNISAYYMLYQHVFYVKYRRVLYVKPSNKVYIFSLEPEASLTGMTCSVMEVVSFFWCTVTEVIM